jgi:hypothetical protein
VKDYCTCEDCLYWRQRTPETPKRAECHRNPPLRIVDGDTCSWSEWPTTDKDDWCGEFKHTVRIWSKP